MPISVRTGSRLRLSAVLLVLGLTGGAAARTQINLGPDGDLQATINGAVAGDVINLAPGATYRGNFVLPARSGGAVITIRTRPGEELPRVGQRVRPQDASKLAKLQSPNASPALRTAPGARGWRLELLEFGPNAGGAGDIIALGDGSAAQSSLAQVPRDLAIDRCYVHGDPVVGQKRGIALNSASTEITGSHISDIKAVGIDTQAICGWNGPGPYRIENNHLEAAGEGFMLGGAPPGIRDMVPSDVVFTRNYVARPESWISEKWQVKNLFELKNARRVMVASNLFENNWLAAQPGYAIVLTPRGEGGQAAWATVEDVTFTRNIVRNVAAGINLLGHDDGGPSGLARRIQITENLFYGFDRDKWKGNGFFFLISDGPTDVIVIRNTIIQRGNLIEASGRRSGAPIPIERFIFRDNIALHNAFGVHGQGRGVGRDTLDSFFPDAEFDHNVIAGGNPSAYPAPNAFPSTAELMNEFVAPDAGDFRLKPGSRYLTAASDGGPLGAPMRQLRLVQLAVQPRDRDDVPPPGRGRGSGG